MTEKQQTLPEQVWLYCIKMKEITSLTRTRREESMWTNRFLKNKKYYCEAFDPVRQRLKYVLD